MNEAPGPLDVVGDAPVAPVYQCGSPGLAEGEEFELPFFVDGGKLKAQWAQVVALLMLPAHNARPFAAVGGRQFLLGQPVQRNPSHFEDSHAFQSGD